MSKPPKGQCNIRCFNAKHQKCVCRCKKRYHGLGRVHVAGQPDDIRDGEPIDYKTVKRKLNLDELIQQRHHYTLEELF
jgi:hypothetical protein